MSIQKRILGLGALTAMYLLFPATCYAGAGTQLIINIVQMHILNNAVYVFGPLAMLAMFFYGYRAIVESNSEGGLTTLTKSFVNAVIGFAIIGLAVPISNAFISSTPGLLVPGIESIIGYLVTAGAGLFTFMMTIHGLQLIAGSNDSGAREKAIKGIGVNVGGAVLMLIARAIVGAVNGNAPALVVNEIAGMIQFLLGIIGVLSVVAMIVSGIFLVISVEESLKDRAKKTIVGTIISLVIVIGCFTLLNTLFNL